MDQLSTLIEHPVFDALVRTLQRSDLRKRKQILLLCRYGKTPEHFANLLDKTEEGMVAWIVEIYHVLRLPFPTHIATVLHDEEEGQRQLNLFLENPLYRGAAIMAIFIYTPSKAEVEKIKLESYLKEVNVMDGPSNPPVVNFGVFFGDHDAAFHPDVAPNPKMAKTVKKSIDEWIRRITSYTHVPKMSNKLLTGRDRHSINSYLDSILHEPQFSTQADLELLEYYTGIHLDNATELKQRWYTNGLSPRSYYVCGSGLYYDVRYTQRMWNDLVDSLSVTQRNNRVNPGRIYVEHMKHALFYDLTSFTSNMSMQRPFLEHLAKYCEEYEIRVMSTSEGLISLPLGQVIRHYNNSNTFPPFYCPALATMWPDDGIQGVAGFLGVYGNIATCMFLHGAVLLQIATREDEVGVAGDDAVIVVRYGDEGGVWVCVQLCGILALDKTFDSDSDAVYLKRGVSINQFSRIRLNQYVQLPSMLYFLSKNDLDRFRERHLPRSQLRELAIKSLGSMFNSCATIDEQYIPHVRQFAAGYYRLLNITEHGNVPQLYPFTPHGTRALFYPCVDFIGSDTFVTDTIGACYDGVSNISVKSRRVLEEECDLVLVKGTVFLAYTQPTLTFLYKLGFIDRIGVERETVYAERGLERLKREYTKNVRQTVGDVVYRWKVAQDIPADLRGGATNVYGEYDTDFGQLLWMKDRDTVEFTHALHDPAYTYDTDSDDDDMETD